MADLKFANTHNLVVFLSKPTESEGFEQIVDFMNANPIKYALTINPTIYTSCIEQLWATAKAKTINGEVQLQALVDGKKVIITESTVRRDLQLEDAEGADCLPNATIFEQLTLIGNSKRKDTEVPQPSGPTTNVADEAVNEEMYDSLERAVTTSTSLDAEQDRGNINKTQSKATPNEPSSPRTSSGGGFRRQDTMRDTIAQTGFENVSKTSNDSLLAGINTPQSDEDSIKLKELMDVEKKGGSRTQKLKRLYKVGLTARVESSEDKGLGEEDASKQERIADIDADAGITLASTHFDVDTDMFGVHDLDGDEVIVENVDVVKTAKEIVITAAIIVSAAIITEVDITLAQALAELNSAKPKATTTLTTTTAATTITAASTRPKAKGLVIHEQEQAPTPTPIVSSPQSS
ncbi:hypothetical protein Tco_1197415 [Tanacetum coccineum]